MGDVVELSSYRQTRKPKISLSEAAKRHRENLLSLWEEMAKKNSLPNYICSCLPKSTEGLDVLGNLNDVQHLEMVLHCSPVVFSPLTLDAEQIGWVTAFDMDDERIQTPQMGSENAARVFAVLLTLRLRRFKVENSI